MGKIVKFWPHTTVCSFSAHNCASRHSLLQTFQTPKFSSDRVLNYDTKYRAFARIGAWQQRNPLRTLGSSFGHFALLRISPDMGSVRDTPWSQNASWMVSLCSICSELYFGMLNSSVRSRSGRTIASEDGGKSRNWLRIRYICDFLLIFSTSLYLEAYFVTDISDSKI